MALSDWTPHHHQRKRRRDCNWNCLVDLQRQTHFSALLKLSLENYFRPFLSNSTCFRHEATVKDLNGLSYYALNAKSLFFFSVFLMGSSLEQLLALIGMGWNEIRVGRRLRQTWPLGQTGVLPARTHV